MELNDRHHYLCGTSEIIGSKGDNLQSIFDEVIFADSPKVISNDKVPPVNVKSFGNPVKAKITYKGKPKR
jgi:hypothetical protein